MFSMRREGYCPSCGRYIGAAEVCPYCGARVKTRISLKALMVFALLTSAIGIGALYYAATGAQPPLVYIKDINETMNYARVKIIGYVVTSASYDEQSRRLYFRIMDINGTTNKKYKTNSIPVYAYAPVSDELKSRGILPVSGDYVEVVGTLRVRDTISMIVNYPDDIKIIRKEPIEVTLEELALNWHVYLRNAVKVTAWVSSYTDYGSFIVASLRDYAYPDYEISLYVPQPARELTGNLTEFFAGDKITVIGNLWVYRGEPEIVPWNSTCITIVEKLKPSTIKELFDNSKTYADERRIAMVNATVVDAYYSTYGWAKIYLNDNSTPQNLTVYFPSSVFEEIPEDVQKVLLTIGARVVIVGVCEFYKDEFELYISDASWVLSAETGE